MFINDDEAGLHHDFEVFLERLAPHEPISAYRHNDTGEDNGGAHIKRPIVGRSSRSPDTWAVDRAYRNPRRNSNGQDASVTDFANAFICAYSHELSLSGTGGYLSGSARIARALAEHRPTTPGRPPALRRRLARTKAAPKAQHDGRPREVVPAGTSSIRDPPPSIASRISQTASLPARARHGRGLSFSRPSNPSKAFLHSRSASFQLCSTLARPGRAGVVASGELRCESVLRSTSTVSGERRFVRRPRPSSSRHSSAQVSTC